MALVSGTLLPSSCKLFVGGWLGRILPAHDIPGATTFIAGIGTGLVILDTLEVEDGVVGEVMVVIGAEGVWRFSLPSLMETCSLQVVVSAAVGWEQDITGKLLGLTHLLTFLASVVSKLSI